MYELDVNLNQEKKGRICWFEHEAAALGEWSESIKSFILNTP